MMKWVTIVLIAGFIVLYFMDAAFKIEFLNLEILIPSRNNETPLVIATANFVAVISCHA